MKVIGLTGGIGMGKSTCAELLRARGVPVVDTDELARRVVEPGEAPLAEVVRLFGADILGHDGRLRRDELARRAFSNPEARKQLEQILHPPITSLWRTQVESWRQENRPLAVVVIPLLFETQAERQLDATICVACSAATQRQRLTARNWPPEQIQQRIDAQLPAEEKMARSNYVIWTEGELDLHEEQLKRILERISSSQNEKLPITNYQ